MKILLTGATGYIGQRLLPVLLEAGHEVVCCVRNVNGIHPGRYQYKGKLKIMEADLMKPASLQQIPADIDAAYYLVHSMSTGSDFYELEKTSAQNFTHAINKTNARQIIYLSGIVNSNNLSRHLSSRKNVEDILSLSNIPVTTLRAGIIVGSGSASFEIIRDLVEKLPVMIAPKWLDTRCQPIAIRNVIDFLSSVLLKEFTFGRNYDIYGPDILTYKQMLLHFAEVRGLKLHIFSVPVMTPRLSSYWLYFVTATSYPLAMNLVESMKVDVVGRTNDLSEKFGIQLIPYKEAIALAFDKIEQNMVISSWKDTLGQKDPYVFSEQIKVPEYGCFKDRKTAIAKDVTVSADRIFAIGGESGWYYANWLWNFRGFLDKLFGGIGLNRGRKNRNHISVGESLDFWRVIYANRTEKRLLLYAEMKLPGEAWLEFRIVGNEIIQTATFRPLGISGRLYWYALLPFHYFIFNGMINKIAN